MQAWPRTDEIPFDAQHRFMATLHHDHDGHATIFVKGAPDVKYQDVIWAMDVARGAGVKVIGVPPKDAAASN